VYLCSSVESRFPPFCAGKGACREPVTPYEFPSFPLKTFVPADGFSLS
jgi:hypothetical protein